MKRFNDTSGNYFEFQKIERVVEGESEEETNDLLRFKEIQLNMRNGKYRYEDYKWIMEKCSTFPQSTED